MNRQFTSCVVRYSVAVWALFLSLAVAVPNHRLAADDSLLVGMASADITPPMGYPMSGYFHPRHATDVLDPLHAKAIVFRQRDQLACIVICDLLGIARDLSHEVRKRAAKATGIPIERIIIAATHTHTGPDYHAEFFDTSAEALDDYQDKSYPVILVRQIVQAIEEAHEGCHAMSIQAGAGENDQVAFNRRFVMEDGSVQTWANYRDPSVLRAAGPIDPRLEMLLFRQADSNELAGSFASYALHLDTSDADKKNSLGADYPAVMQRVLHEQLGSKFLLVFGTGTCGDINHVTPYDAERNSQAEIGAALADTFLQAMPQLRDISPQLNAASRTISLPLQSVTPTQIAHAKQVLQRIQAGETVPMLDHVDAHRVTRLAALHASEDTKRSREEPQSPARKLSPSLVGIGDALPIELQAIQLANDTAIVALPGEVFVDLGLAIKRYSPYEQTFVVELANMDDIAYVPTKLAAAGGGYEVINSVLAPGAGEQIVETTIHLLREMKRGINQP